MAGEHRGVPVPVQLGGIHCKAHHKHEDYQPDLTQSVEIAQTRRRKQSRGEAGGEPSKQEGPRRIPATISPITCGCLIFWNRKPTTRAAIRITAICSTSWKRLSITRPSSWRAPGGPPGKQSEDSRRSSATLQYALAGLAGYRRRQDPGGHGIACHGGRDSGATPIIHRHKSLSAGLRNADGWLRQSGQTGSTGWPSLNCSDSPAAVTMISLDAIWISSNPERAVRGFPACQGPI